MNTRLLSLFAIMVMVGAFCSLKNIGNASAYETSSATQLGLKQQSDNTEVCGTHARAQSYSFYANPCLNGVPLTFSGSTITISNMQSGYNLLSSPYTINTPSNGYSGDSGVVEYTVGNGMDSLISTTLSAEANPKFAFTTKTLNVGSTVSGSSASVDAWDESVWFTQSGNTPGSPITLYTWNSTYTGISSQTLSDLGNPSLISSQDGNVMHLYGNDNSLWSVNFTMTLPNAYSYSLNYALSYDGKPVYFLNGAIEEPCAVMPASPISITPTYSQGVYSYQITFAGSQNADSVYLDYLSITIVPIGQELKQTYTYNVSGAVASSNARVIFYMFCEGTSYNPLSLSINGQSEPISNGNIYYWYVLSVPIVNSMVTVVIDALGSIVFPCLIDYAGVQCWYDLYYSGQLTATYKVNNLEYTNPITTSQILNLVGTLSYGAWVGSYGPDFPDDHYVYNYTWSGSISSLTYYNVLYDTDVESIALSYSARAIDSSVGFGTVSFQTQYLYGNWEAPSVAGLSLDGVLATDTSYNTGIIYLTSYSDTLDFVATDPAVFFDFNITSFFTITIDLNILSYSFYSGTYELTTPHALTLTDVDYLFNSSIYDSYLNNVEQGSSKSLTPNLSLVSSETLSIEVIISDQAYIPAYVDIPNQLANTTTESTSVLFNQTVTATKSFNNWYIPAISTTINSLTVYDETHGVFLTVTNDGSQYYFSSSYIQAQSQFIATWDVNPNFAVSNQIVFDNGTNISLQITIHTDLTLQNVTVITYLSEYFDHWSNATQDSYTKNISSVANLTAGSNSFIIYGSRPVPSANYSRFVSDAGLTIDPEYSYQVNYAGYLNYSSFSQIWHINTSPTWTLDGVHYGDSLYTVQNNTFFCEGFDSSISSSYLAFSTDPIDSYEQTVTNTSVILNITCNLPITQVYLTVNLNLTGNYKINTAGLQSLGSGMYMFLNPQDLANGTNLIVISYSQYTLANNWWIIFPILGIFGAVFIYFYVEYRKSSDYPRKTFTEFLNTHVHLGKKGKQAKAMAKKDVQPKVIKVVEKTQPPPAVKKEIPKKEVKKEVKNNENERVF